MSKELLVLLSNRVVGRVVQDDRGKLAFSYEEAWRDTRGAYPLSISMPLAALEHGNDAISAFIWGLLPDNELILDRWAKKFQVSAEPVCTDRQRWRRLRGRGTSIYSGVSAGGRPVRVRLAAIGIAISETDIQLVASR